MKLGPPVIPVQENHPPRGTRNRAFELYWQHGLAIAQQWRERLGLGRKPLWDDVRAHLAPLPVKGGVYLAHENCPQTFTERNRDHPSLLEALGVAEWRWEDTWGWDFPMVAMTAANLKEPDLVAKALAMETPKNIWRANGHNWQRANLPSTYPVMAASCWLRRTLPAEAHFRNRGARWEGLPATPLY